MAANKRKEIIVYTNTTFQMYCWISFLKDKRISNVL